MPIVQISLVSGRPAELRHQLILDVTDAVERALDVPRSSIRVLITEVPPEHFAVGGVTKADLPAEQRT